MSIGVLVFASLYLCVQALAIPEFVTVAYPNNLPDTNGWPTEFGTVPYTYKIGKYETKVSEYAAFLNSVASTSDPRNLYSGEVLKFIDRSSSAPYVYSPKAGASNKPIGGVTWLGAARYANWLHNGAANVSSTESGAYDLAGATSGVFFRNAGARYWIPSEAEWYKAAYYDPTLNAGLGGYWKYATRSNAISTNEANYGLFFIDLSTIREVGSYSNRPSAYGTFDQTGNLHEIVSEDSLAFYDAPMEGSRGGSLNYGTYSDLYSISSSNRGVGVSSSYLLLGFRLASASDTNTYSVLQSLEFVPVGQTNNAAHFTGYGQVNYPYEISKYEVTIEQYAAFLNAVAKSDPYGLFDTNMESDTFVRGIQRRGVSGNYQYFLRGTGNRPIAYINWFRAARFANWLHNGATTNPLSTETGAYALNGTTSAPVPVSSTAIYRLPTENEWFKAAYYDAASNKYWNYPTRSDTPPTNILWSTGPVATYSNNGFFTLGNDTMANPNKLSGVGQTRSPSSYGTYDQGGNLWEWTDTFTEWGSGITRGGAWIQDSSTMLIASANNRNTPWASNAWSVYGFRLAKNVSTNSSTNPVIPPPTNSPTPTNPPASNLPSITSFVPTELAPGDEIDVYGTGFGTPSNTILTDLRFEGGFGLDADPLIWSDTHVQVKVPVLAGSGYLSLYFTSPTSGQTEFVTSPSPLRIISKYEQWKKSLGFTNDGDRPAQDNLTILDRYFHGFTNSPTNPQIRPFVLQATEIRLNSQAPRITLKLQRARHATEADFWIERSVNLAPSGWQKISPDVEVKANPGDTNLEDITLTDLSSSNSARGFYRLVISTNTNLTQLSLTSLPTAQERNQSVSFPKIFQPWPNVSKVLLEVPVSGIQRSLETNEEAQRYIQPRHSLNWEALWKDTNRNENFFTGPSEVTKMELRQGFLSQKKLNPNSIRLATLEYFEGETNNPAFGLPASSSFYLRNQSNGLIRNWDIDLGGTNFTCLFDFSNPQFQELIADRAAALTADGLYDGVFIDCWSEPKVGDSIWTWIGSGQRNQPGGSPRPWGLTNATPTGGSVSEVEKKARMDLLKKIRERIGTNKLIIANINYGLAGDNALSDANPLLSGAYLDGVYMECYMLEQEAPSHLIRDLSNNPVAYDTYLSQTPYFDDRGGSTYWKKLEQTLAWVEKPGNLKSQGFNCIEIWHRFSKTDSRDLRIMRAGLSLVLTCSDSYYLFCEPNWWQLDPGRGRKRHAWYDAWNKSLGRPVDPKRSPIDNSQKIGNGMYSRAFDQGIVFYNPPDNPQKTLLFAKPVKSVSTGNTATSHTIGAGPDGDIFLLTQPGDPR